MISILTICILTIPTAAEEPEQAQLDAFYAAVRTAIVRGEDRVHVENLGVDKDSLATIYRSFLWENPDVSFCLAKTVDYTYNGETGTVIYITLIYDNKDTVASRSDWLKQRVDSIVVDIDPKWTDLQKLLWINDYVCDNFRYDLDSMNRTAYDLLFTGKGICEGYTALVTLLAQKCDIPVSYCYSQGLQHIWNMVRLDGSWFHLDATWNDSYTDRYEFFLLSDSEDRYTRGTAYDVNKLHVASDTKYDNAFWRNDIYSSFVFDEGDTYFVQGNKIMKADLDHLTFSVVRSLSEAYWKAPNTNSYYENKFYDLTNIGDLLIYNTPTKIFAYSLVTMEHFQIATWKEGYEIYAIRADRNGLTFNYVSNLREDIFVQETRTIPTTHTVTYYVDGAVYDTQTYFAGKTLEYPRSDPFKIGFVFSGWSVESNTAVHEPMTVYASFEIDETRCNVIFMSNGEVYHQESILIGTPITLPKTDPVKASDAYYTYTFAGWKNYTEGVTAYGSTMVFIAEYTGDIRIYTVKFYDGEELKSTQTCTAGTPFAILTKPVISNKTMDGVHLIFKGWNPAVTEITADHEFYAVYETETVYVYVRYYSEGVLFHEQKIASGTSLDYIDDAPKKNANGSIVYVFDGWIGLKEGTVVYTDIDLNAVFKKIQLQPSTAPVDPPVNNNEPIDDPDPIESDDPRTEFEDKIIILVIGTFSLILIAAGIGLLFRRRK